MWEAIKVMANNQVIFICFLMFAIIVLFIFLYNVKKGRITFQGKGFNIGTADKERNIILNQTQYLESEVEIFYASLKLNDDSYKSKYVAERVKNKLEECIHVNHINMDPTYLSLKYSICLKEVLRYYDDVSDDFKSKLKDEINKVIQELLKIRTYNEGK